MNFNKSELHDKKNKLLKLITKWEMGSGNKKYKVTFNNGKSIQFGNKQYFQYKDSSPLKLYKFLNHLDKDRQRLYFQRHNKNYDLISADTLSKAFLWS
jgi:hypothetical protein